MAVPLSLDANLIAFNGDAALNPYLQFNIVQLQHCQRLIVSLCACVCYNNKSCHICMQSKTTGINWKYSTGVNERQSRGQLKRFVPLDVQVNVTNRTKYTHLYLQVDLSVVVFKHMLY